MKNKSIVFMLLASVMILTSCASAPASPTQASYFSKNDKATGIAEVNETLVYDVSSKPEYSLSEIPTDTAYLYPELSGTYTTTLRSTEYNGESCYELTSLLTVTGKYVLYENGVVSREYPVDDTTSSLTYLLPFEKNFTPIRSEKSVKCTSPLNSEITKLDYSVETLYENGSAKTEFTYNDEDTEKAFSGHDKTFTKKYKRASFVDNEAITFYFRTFKITDNFSYTFNTLDCVSQTMQKMVCSLSSSAPTKVFNLTLENEDGQKNDVEITCDCLLIGINSSYSGSSITCYYASSDEQNLNRHRPVQMIYSLPYLSMVKSGVLEYTLIKIA